VEQDFPMRAGDSDILTEMARPTAFLHLPHFGKNDPSTKIVPLHPMQCAPRLAALFVGEAQRVRMLFMKPRT